MAGLEKARAADALAEREGQPLSSIPPSLFAFSRTVASNGGPRSSPSAAVAGDHRQNRETDHPAQQQGSAANDERRQTASRLVAPARHGGGVAQAAPGEAHRHPGRATDGDPRAALAEREACAALRQVDARERTEADTLLKTGNPRSFSFDLNVGIGAVRRLL